MTEPSGLAVLVADARAGSRMALDRLLYDLGDALLPLANAVARDPAEADRLLADTLSRVYERLGQLRREESVVAWARRILVRLAADEHRWWRRSPVVQVAIDTITGEGLEPEVRIDLRRAVDGLRKADRTLLALHYWMGLSIEECAHEMGLPSGTVKSRLNVALRRVRARLEG